jgi:predicted dienelactone hydrolase
MHTTRRAALAMLLVLASVVRLSLAQEAVPYKADTGPWRFEVLDDTWRDNSRADDEGQPRDVPVRVYLPKDAGPDTPTDKRPVVIFSHGYGGSRDGYTYIGRHLASHGYLVIHPQHAGSDTDALRKLLRESRRRGEKNPRGSVLEEGTSDPDNLVNRPLDIRFVIDQLATRSTLAAIADAERIAVAGHSFGSYTAMAVAGMRITLPDDHAGAKKTLRDERVKAIIAMSPQGPGVMGVTAGAWNAITIPALLMTGSKDMGQGQRAVAWRLTPFSELKNPATRLLYIDEATHMTFSGANSTLLRPADTPRDVADRHMGFIKQTCTAFLDAHLCNDAAAKKWIDDKAIETLSKNECELRSKSPADR